MSAAFYGGDIRETKRYKLGKLLSSLTRHFLLLTATPHNGKEADFQLFMALLDGDRFEGKFRDGVHTVDTSDLMRRLVKEDLLKFDGKPLFPERQAYTVEYHHFIGSFFIEAFQHLGGVIRQSEPKRYQITNVPALIRNRGRQHLDWVCRGNLGTPLGQIGTREPILTRYERICFDKELISVPGKPLAAFICPGHP